MVSAGRGGMFTLEFSANSSVIVVVKDNEADKLVRAVLGKTHGGIGKIFVSDVNTAIDIGTGNEGDSAI